LLRTAEPPLEVSEQWLGPPPREAGAFAGARRAADELRRLLRDRSRYLLLLYPQIPALDLGPQATVPPLAKRAYQTLGFRARLTRRRLLIFVGELPIERAAGRAVADGRSIPPEPKPIRDIEATLFRSAHRLIVPAGFVEPIRERYGIDPSRFLSFRRLPYPPESPLAEPPPLEFESGSVNFFYSGSVDGHVAPNFRAVLKSIRNAPTTRLHVCGAGRDAVREWLNELDAPNVRHYGQLGMAEHDWLAQRCDVGLILHPSENPYDHLRPTLKYSAYLANGLPVLATDLRHVAENVRQDGVGQALPIRELEVELLRWATRPKLWKSAKTRAVELAAEIRRGTDLRPGIQEIAEGR
jgi:glycosyltransferase involved in cell wall biosynthesis